jgi:protein TonB
VKAPTKITDVKPIYPPLAQAARKEGIVILELLIGKDGRVKDAKVVRSVQLLDEAALTAVRQWVFTPTTLNGEPQEIIYNVTVTFQLR